MEKVLDNILPIVERFTLFDLAKQPELIASQVATTLERMQIKDATRNYLVVMFIAHKLFQAKSATPDIDLDILAQRVCARLEDQFRDMSTYSFVNGNNSQVRRSTAKSQH